MVVIRVVAVVRSSLSVRAAMLASRVVGDDGAKGGLWCSPVERLTERCEGVLVLADLGSGIMSAEMALEMLDPALAERTRLSAAPFIEGLLGAYGAAGIGKDLQAVATEADGAAEAKRSQVTAF
nr:dihydroxyacetone kinase [Actinomyces oris]